VRPVEPAQKAYQKFYCRRPARLRETARRKNDPRRV